MNGSRSPTTTDVDFPGRVAFRPGDPAPRPTVLDLVNQQPPALLVLRGRLKRLAWCRGVHLLPDETVITVIAAPGFVVSVILLVGRSE